MKNIFTAFVLFLALEAFSQSNVFPILRGKLQSNLNGGGFSITNVAGITGTNGQPFSGGSSGPTNYTVAGTNISIVVSGPTNTISADVSHAEVSAKANLTQTVSNLTQGSNVTLTITTLPNGQRSVTIDGISTAQASNLLAGIFQPASANLSNFSLLSTNTFYNASNPSNFTGTNQTATNAASLGGTPAARFVQDNNDFATNLTLVNPTSSGGNIVNLGLTTNWNLTYVSTQGSDTNNGLSQYTPLLTITNALAAASNNTRILLSPGGYYNWNTNGLVYLPRGTTLSGSAEFTIVTNHIISLNTDDTNTTQFALSDNSTIENFILTTDFPIVGNFEGAPITLAGSQRKLLNGYTHIAETSTNVLIRNITGIVPPKRNFIVFDATNTFSVTLRDNNIQCNQGYAVAVGNTEVDGSMLAGELISPAVPSVVNNTKSVANFVSGYYRCNPRGAIGTPGMAPLLLSSGSNYVSAACKFELFNFAAQPTSGYQASGAIIAGTNTTVSWLSADCSFTGSASIWTNGGGNVLSTIIMSGSNNVLNLYVPLAIVDVGISNTINRLYLRDASSFTNYAASNIVSGGQITVGINTAEGITGVVVSAASAYVGENVTIDSTGIIYDGSLGNVDAYGSGTVYTNSYANENYASVNSVLIESTDNINHGSGSTIFNHAYGNQNFMSSSSVFSNAYANVNYSSGSSEFDNSSDNLNYNSGGSFFSVAYANGNYNSESSIFSNGSSANGNYGSYSSTFDNSYACVNYNNPSAFFSGCNAVDVSGDGSAHNYTNRTSLKASTAYHFFGDPDDKDQTMAYSPTNLVDGQYVTGTVGMADNAGHATDADTAGSANVASGLDFTGDNSFTTLDADGNPSNSGYTSSSFLAFGANSTNIVFGYSQTNLVGGRLYTNGAFAIQISSVNSVQTTASVLGIAQGAIYVFGVATNYSPPSLSAIGGFTGTVTNTIPVIIVPPSAVYCVTNISSGVGDSSTFYGGQIITF